MSDWFLGAVTLLYAGAGLTEFYQNGNVPRSLIFAGYVIANIGLWLSTLQK